MLSVGVNVTEIVVAVDLKPAPLYVIVVAVFAVAALFTAGLCIVTAFASLLDIVLHFPATLGVTVNVFVAPYVTVPSDAPNVIVGVAFAIVKFAVAVAAL